MFAISVQLHLLLLFVITSYVLSIYLVALVELLYGSILFALGSSTTYPSTI